MASRSDIGWEKRPANSPKLKVKAKKVSNKWQIFVRSKKFDPWQRLTDPELEDWVALLGAVERRVARRFLRPEEADQLRAFIRTRFPEHDGQ